MKFSLDHLKRYLKTNKSVTELADKMTMLGLEVEEIHDGLGHGHSIMVCKRKE